MKSTRSQSRRDKSLWSTILARLPARIAAAIAAVLAAGAALWAAIDGSLAPDAGVKTASRAPLMVPSYQVSARTNNFAYIPDTNDTAQLIFDWLDDTLPGFVDATTVTNLLGGYLPGTNIVGGAYSNGEWNLGPLLPGTNIVDGVYSNQEWNLGLDEMLPGTNIVGATYNAGALEWTIDPATAGASPAATDPGYLSGFYPAYVDTNTVSILPGACYVGTNLCYSAATNNVDIAVTAGRDFVYIYLDGASSGTNLTFTSSRTEPAERADGSWYNGDDRLIASVRLLDGEAKILPFQLGGGTSARSLNIVPIYPLSDDESELTDGADIQTTNVWCRLDLQVGSTLELMTPVNVRAIHFNAGVTVDSVNSTVMQVAFNGAGGPSLGLADAGTVGESKHYMDAGAGPLNGTDIADPHFRAVPYRHSTETGAPGLMLYCLHVYDGNVAVSFYQATLFDWWERR